MALDVEGIAKYLKLIDRLPYVSAPGDILFTAHTITEIAGEEEREQMKKTVRRDAIRRSQYLQEFVHEHPDMPRELERWALHSAYAYRSLGQALGTKELEAIRTSAKRVGELEDICSNLSYAMSLVKAERALSSYNCFL